MMRDLIASLIAGLGATGLLAGGCQSGAGKPEPALLIQGDGPAMEQLMAALEKDMGRRLIDLGPSDPTLSPVISVLPVPSGPLNDRNPALPTVFRLEFDGQTCSLFREETGLRITLDGVKCRAAASH